MSNVSQFFSSGGSGSVPLGGFTAFTATMANSLTIGTETFLKSGVVTLASNYPNFPYAAIPAITTLTGWTDITMSSGYQPLAANPTGTFIQVSQGTGNFATSTDGITWTERNGCTNAGAWNYPSYAIWADSISKFVAFSLQGMHYSDTGAVWVPSATLTNLNPSGMATNGTIVLAYSSSSSTIRRSINGTSWTDITGPFGQVNAMSFGNGLFVASTPGSLFSSPDGITWTSRTSASTMYTSVNQSSAFGNGTFVVQTNSGYFRSTDALTWTQITGLQPNVTLGFAMRFVGGLFITTTASGLTYQTSVDGNTWRQSTVAATSSKNFGSAYVLHNGTKFLAFMGGGPPHARTATTTAAYLDNFAALSPYTSTNAYMRVA